MAHQNQSPRFSLHFALGVIHSMSLNKYPITCVHHYNIIQNGFNVLKLLCAPPIHPFSSQTPPLATTDLFTVSIFVYSGTSQSWNRTVWSLFRWTSLTLCAWGSSTSFHDLLTHFFLLLNNTHHLDGPQFIHSLTTGNLGCFQLWALTNKAAVNNCVQVFSLSFWLLWVNA